MAERCTSPLRTLGFQRGAAIALGLVLASTAEPQPALSHGLPHENRDTVRLEDFSLLEMTWLGDADPWFVSHGRLGLVRIRDEGCAECLAGRFDLGFGVGQSLLESKRLTYFVRPVDLTAQASRGFRGSDVRLGFGATGGVYVGIGKRVGTFATASWHRVLVAEPGRTYDVGLTVRWWTTERLALEADGRRYPTVWEGTFGLTYGLWPVPSEGRPIP